MKSKTKSSVGKPENIDEKLTESKQETNILNEFFATVFPMVGTENILELDQGNYNQPLEPSQ